VSSRRTRRWHRVYMMPSLLSLAILASACGPFRNTPDTGQAYLHFSNESIEQADVYVVASGNQAVRIGTVFAGRSETLTVPSSVVSRGGQVNIVARFLARSATAQSGPVPLQRGDRLEIRLPIDQKLLVVLPAR
jgi:hypothetical protein